MPAQPTDALSIEANAKYLADNAKKKGVITRPSGLQFRIIQNGYGKRPTATDTVKVYYTGTLINGSDLRRHLAGTARHPSSSTAVIPGWIEALQLMREGDHWQLVIPPNLGYGARGAGRRPIPPNQTLIFDIKLLEPRPRPGAARRAISPIPATRRRTVVTVLRALDARLWTARHLGGGKLRIADRAGRWWSAPARCSGPAATIPSSAPEWDGQVRGIAYNPSHLFTPATSKNVTPEQIDRDLAQLSQAHRPYPHLYGGRRHGQGAGDRAPLRHDRVAGHLDQPRPGARTRSRSSSASAPRWPTGAPSTG